MWCWRWRVLAHPAPQSQVALVEPGEPGVDRITKLELFKQPRREHEFGVGTIAGVAAKVGERERNGIALRSRLKRSASESGERSSSPERRSRITAESETGHAKSLKERVSRTSSRWHREHSPWHTHRRLGLRGSSIVTDPYGCRGTKRRS